MSTTLKTNSDNSVTGITPGTSIADIIAQVTVSGGTVEILTPDEKVKTEGNIATGDMIAGKDESGNYVSVYTVVIYGDVNGDGKVSVADARKLIVAIAKGNTEDLIEFGDVNGDGRISVADVRKIVVAIAKNDFNF